MTDLLRASPSPTLPLYAQVAQVLKDEIVSGRHPVGATLPKESDLCVRFGVSRHTIREALRNLREDRLVTSRQGAGTVVIPPPLSGSYVHQITSINDLVSFAKEAPFEISTIRMVAIDAKLASLTGLDLGREWLEVQGFRHTESLATPKSWTHYYINREFAAIGRLLPRHNGPFFSLIEDMFGQTIGEVHQEMAATQLTPDLAAALDGREGSAALQTRRTYRTIEGKTAQVTITTHVEPGFQYVMTMRRVRG